LSFISETPVGGGFKVESFYTSQCKFNCYKIKVLGTWKSDIGGKKKSGKIESIYDGYGLGADAETKIDLSSFPDNVRLIEFRWSASTGGRKIPSLIDEIIEDIPIKVIMNSFILPSSGFKEMTLSAK
jgi:hypothetical protein